MQLEALLFDVDGTLAETEELHRHAFNDAFASLKLAWDWSPALYRELLRVAGGKERILYYVTRWRPDELAAVHRRIASIHQAKTDRYAALIRRNGTVHLRPGVARLIEEARRKGIRLAIATTTNRSNVQALLRRTLGPSGEDRFEVIVAGDEAAAKKPEPHVFEIALRTLGLPAAACIAFEDSANGVLAARRAGLPVVATPSGYTPDDHLAAACSVVSDLGEPDRPHEHLAGWTWPRGFVHIEALREHARERNGVM